MNALLWVIWAVTTRGRHGFLPWPIWSTVFWGVGLVSQGVRVYGGWSKPGMAEREYERLVQAQNDGK